MITLSTKTTIEEQAKLNIELEEFISTLKTVLQDEFNNLFICEDRPELYTENFGDSTEVILNMYEYDIDIDYLISNVIKELVANKNANS